MVAEMLRFLALFLLPLFATAAERWVELRSGPFEVLTSTGDRGAREVLGRLEQFRHAFGAALGKQDLVSTWPIRVVVFRPRREGPTPVPPTFARDSFIGSLAAGEAVPPNWFRELARIFLEANTNRMPSAIEAGLIDFYSTIEIIGTRVTLGHPIPEAERNTNWALIHLLSTSTDYYGRLRSLLYNLQQGVDEGPAYRNSVGKTAEEIRREAAAWLAAGNFPTAPGPSRPLNVNTDLRPEPATGYMGDLALADLALVTAAGRAGARAAYEAILKRRPDSAEAREGLALLALKERNLNEARNQLSAAAEAGSRNARVYVEAARLESDPQQTIAALRKALELKPGWAEPHFLIAGRLQTETTRAEALAAAAKLEPRNAGYWQALAEAQMSLQNFREAARSWAAAERASTDLDERDRIRARRASIEEQRLEAEAKARRKAAEEEARDLERLKEAAMTEVRAAEARANAAAGGGGRSPEAWFEGPAPSGKVSGRLRQVDCLRGALRLVIDADAKKATQLLIRNPGKVVVIGGGELLLTCGPQRPVRNVTVEYFPGRDAQLAVEGEVATIEYR